MKKNHIIIFLIFFYAGQGFSLTTTQSAGVQIAIYGSEPFSENLYSLPSGMGIYYTLTSGKTPSIFLGTDILWYGFTPLNNFYGDSFMLIQSIAAGYRFRFTLRPPTALVFSPYLTCGYYTRRITTQDAAMWFTRPVLTLGVETAVEAGKRASSSIGLFVTFIMDNTPVVMPGLLIRTGYRWGGGL